LTFNLNQFIQSGLFDGYSVASLYVARQIRFLSDSFDPNVGNDGRYIDLDPQTTMFELLTALSLYYNAELFIDPETNKLTMIRRNTVQNDLEHDLDKIIINTEPITYYDTDEKKYDYLKSAIQIPKPDTLSGIIVRRRVNLLGAPWYVMTYVVSTGASDIESAASIPAYAEDIDLNNSPSDPYYNDKSFLVRRWFHVPLGPNGTMRRNIYTFVPGDPSHTKPTLLFSINDNTTTDITFDGYNPQGTSELNMAATPPLELYYRYNEDTGKWEDSLYRKVGDDVPPGKIFSINPELRFVNDDGTTKDTNIFDIFAFFGKETNIDIFAEQWIDFFIYEGKAVCTVAGLPYRVGDSFVTTRQFKIPAGKYVCKNAGNRLMKEQTAVELLRV
jgi:hypothetical protein